MKVNFETDFIENKVLNFYTANHRIALDIDEVLADFINGYIERYGQRDITNWYFSYSTVSNLNVLKEDKDFWLNLKPRIKPEDLPFLPVGYVSKRNFPSSWTEEWIERNGFPCVPVIHVEDDKVHACKKLNTEYFIDDSLPNFQRLNAAGIKTFLQTGPHNKQYDVGVYRLLHPKDIIHKI